MTTVLASTIAQLPDAGPLTGSEYVAISQSGATVRQLYTNTASVRVPTVISNAVTVQPTDSIVEIQSITAGVAVSLPSVPIIGLVQTVKDGSGVASVYRITLVPPNGKAIDGQGQFQINSDWGAVSYYYNGTNFRIICGY